MRPLSLRLPSFLRLPGPLPSREGVTTQTVAARYGHVLAQARDAGAREAQARGEPVQVSFVVPAHNEEAYLPATLGGILAEIERAGCTAEVVVVDNASTDRTAEVAAAVPGVRVVSEPQKGLSAARQAGFVASSGRLVANIDADTLLPEGWLTRVLDAFAHDPKLVALSGPYIYYDVTPTVRRMARLFYLVGFGTYSFNRFVLRVGSMLQGGNFVVTRAALERIGGYDPAFTFYGEDTDVARRLHRVGRVRFTLDLPAYSSGRRLAGEGVFMVGWRYSVNYLWATFVGKPFTRSSVDFRP